MKKLLQALALGLMVSFVSAQTADEAVATVKKSVETLQADLKKHKSEFNSNPKLVEDALKRDLVPYLDTHVMAQYVLGKNWRKATPKQREEFLDAFQSMLLRTYAKSFLDYTDAKVKIDDPGAVENKKIKVKGSVTANGGTTEFTLSMRYGEGGWKAYDVIVEGLSLVTSYRSSVGSEIDQKGIDAVIDEMRSLNFKGSEQSG